MGVGITDGVETAAVDTNNNLQVRTPTTETQAGFTQMSSEVDAGNITGTRLVRAAEITQDYRIRVGMDQSWFDLDFAGTNVARDRLRSRTSTLTISQASGGITLNAGAVTTTNSYALIDTYRAFPNHAAYPTWCDFVAKTTFETATNSAIEFGFGIPRANAAPDEGVFFRYSTDGLLYGVVSYAGTETLTSAISISNATYPLTTDVYHHFAIMWSMERAEFWVNDVLRASIDTTRPNVTAVNQQQLFAIVRHTGTASAAKAFTISRMGCTLADAAANKPLSHAMNGMGNGSYQIQPGTASGGTVSRASANFGWPASTTALTVGTWTATTAPAANTLGGRWISPAISTLTSEADYPVFSYLNPAGTTAIPGKTLYITHISLGETIAMAAASTNGIMLCFAIGVGSTSSATTATEGAAVVAARIIPMGQCYFASTATIGTTCVGKEIDFSQSPLVIPQGMYFTFIVRPVGTVTSNTLTVTGSVGVYGYHA